MIEAQAAELHDAAWAAAQSGDMARAILLAGQAAAIWPHPDHLLTLGQFQLAAGRGADAVATLRQAVALYPQVPAVQGTLALALRQASDPAAWTEAVTRLEAAVALAPDDITGQLNLALLRHHAAAADDEVTTEIRRAICLDGRDLDVWADAAAMFHDRGRFAEARDATRQALCLDPAMTRSVHAHAEAVAVMAGAGVALRWFDRLVMLDPAMAVHRVARAKARLAAGDLRGGWDEYEVRRGLPIFGLPAAMPGDSNPQPLSDRTVLVYPEQGFGDIIQFVSFVPPLCRRARHVFLVAHPDLKALFEEMPGGDGRLSVVDAAAASQLHADLAVPVMSLPRLLDMAPQGVPYLRPAPRQRERWSQALAGQPGLRVGVCWSGNPRRDAPLVMRMTDYRRSIPLETFGPALAGIEDATFISLQHGYRAGDVPQEQGIRDASAYIRDFSDLAGLIANLDLVITVDTAVAHLAGALGARTWMLNRFDSCWRWGRGATTTPWYDSMTIFNQATPMDWSVPLAEVRNSLRVLIADQAAAIAARKTLP